MVAKAVVSILNSASISSIKGVHGGRVPQGAALPRVRITSIDAPERCKQGIGMYNYTVQVDVFAHTYKEAQDLGILVRNALEGASGTYEGVQVRDSMYLGGQDGFEDSNDIYQRILEFQVNTNN